MIIVSANGKYYQSIQILGEGTYGTVHLVKECTSQIEYACKIISKLFISKYNASDMIRNEISIQQQLNHKNIVKLYEYWEDYNNLYMLLEYCKKGHLVVPKTPFSDDDTFQVFYQILCGVDYLHNNDIIHRDLKLENILIHEDGTLKICDFGWAIKSITMPVKSEMCGTTECMPPEVVAKQPLNYKVDTWSLGIILYLLTFGIYPFTGENQTELIQSILFKQCTIQKKNINEDLGNLIQALLIKNQNLRPSIQQIYLCKWIKQNMKQKNIYNNYEIEQLKSKVKNRNIQLKVIVNDKFSSPQKMIRSLQQYSKDDHHHELLRVPSTCEKMTNSVRTIKSISTNLTPSPSNNKLKCFNFLDNSKQYNI